MQCKKCKSKNYVKSGFVREKQRYKCKKCGCHFTNTTQGESIGKKRLAVQLYLEGVGFRGIGRTIKVSNVAVMKWIKNLANTIENINKSKDPIRESKEEIKIMELDEMWHYISKKKEKPGSGWLLIEIAKSLDGKSVVVEQKQAKSYGSK